MSILKLRSALIRSRWYLADRRNRRQIRRVEAYLGKIPQAAGEAGRPVLFFNASTRIHRPSLNAGYSLLASWALRARGVPVRYVVCQRGLDPCILGTRRDHYAASPPCRKCLRMSRDLFPADLVVPVPYQAEAAAEAEAELTGLSLEGLGRWEHGGLKLGELCLPGLRWALRRHHLPDDEPTRGLFRRYLRSAASLARQIDSILDELNPRALVVFNGIMYPEAVARAVAMRRGIPVITHEVGLRPYSAFFSHGHATFREVELPSGRELTLAENERLDTYLSDRFHGKFTMAGIRFWPEMEAPPNDLLERMGKHHQTVVVFTNVVFDTSQVHANTLYPDMFTWLEDVCAAIGGHPDTFFVIRAHPDEDRPGKESRESVDGWVRERCVLDLANVAFFGPSDHISSYELIRRSKFVLVYNSSIGLEASIMGAPVLCAGRARYTQLPTVFFPATRQEFLDKMGLWLAASAIDVPAEFVANARRFLDYELYHASLDLSQFLGPYPYHPGMVEFRPFKPPEVRVAAGLCAITSSIPTDGAFLLP